MAIDLDVNSFTELNNNIIDINNKTAPLANMVLNPVPVGSTNKLAVKRGTTWNIEGEEAYNGRLQNFGDISGTISLDMDGAGCRTAMIAEVVGDTFITGFGDNFSSGVVYVLFLRQDPIGGHSVRWPYGASILGMTGTDPDQLTEVYIVKLPNGKVFIKCKAFQNTVEIGSIIKEFEYPASKYPEDGGNAPISFTWSKNPEIAHGGTLSGLYSDWEVASDELFTVLMFSSYGNTVDLYSIEVVLSQSGLAYMRTRYGGEIGGTPVVSPWEQMAVQVSGVPPLWTPADIQDLGSASVWLDADTITGEGSSVLSMVDKLGSVREATQPTPSYRPSFVDNVLNGETVLQFDGGDFLSLGTSLGKPGTYTVFTLGMWASMPAGPTVLCGSSDTTAHSTYSWGVMSAGRIENDGKIEWKFGDGTNYKYGRTSDQCIAPGVWELMSQRYTSGDDLATVRVNGVNYSTVALGGSGTSCSGTAYPFSLGRPGSYNGQYFPSGSGVKALIVVCGVSLSDLEIEKIEGYYAHLCGLVANLPADHPYKYAPPRKFTQDFTWTPAEIGTMWWPDASQDASTGAEMVDMSGNNRSPVQTTPAAQPVKNTSYLTFDGVDDFMVSPLFTIAQPTSLFVVARVHTLAGERTIINQQYPNTLAPWQHYVAATGQIFDWRSSARTPPISVDTFFQFAEIQSDTRIIDMWANGIPGTRGTGVNQYANNREIYIGKFQTSGLLGWMDGDFCEAVLVAGAVDVDLRQKIEGYLAHKWDNLLGINTLVSALPSDHPYKSAPPEGSTPSYTKYETDTTTIIAGNVLEGATGLTISQVNNDALNIGVLVAGSNGGLFRIYANGSWTFDPNSEFGALSYPETADTSVTYYVSDGVSEAGAMLTVTVTSSTTVSYGDAILAMSPLRYFSLAEESGSTIIDQTATQNGLYYNVGTGVLLVNSEITDHPCPKFLPPYTGYGSLVLTSPMTTGFGLSLCFNADFAQCELTATLIGNTQYYASVQSKFPFRLAIDKSIPNISSTLSRGNDFTADDIIVHTIADLTNYNIVINYVGNSYHAMYINGLLVQQNSIAWSISNSGLAWLIAQAHENGGGIGKSGYGGWLSDIVLRATPFSSAEIATLARI